MSQVNQVQLSECQGVTTIFSGDYPDPSILRVGEDYYITHSSFHYTPGLLIWHSRNLVDWEPIGHAIHEHVGSIMAPDLIYYNDLFYIYFPANGTNWVVTAESPEGPWSKPIDLQVGFIDPGHGMDQEGNRYLYLSDGNMIGLTSDGLSTVGELKKVYDGWRYPNEWLTEGFYLESPKLNYKNGYYYMTSAQGGTAGPATSHMIVSARSRTPFGPWENSPYNPLVRTKERCEQWWSKGHGTLVDTPEGDWFIVYHAYEKDYYTLGRQTLMEPIKWMDDGWFTVLEDGLVDVSLHTENSEMKETDVQLTESDRLNLHWHFYGGKRLADFHIENENLVLQGLHKDRTEPLLYIPSHHAYEAIVTISTDGIASGTLSLFYKPGFQCGIGFDGKEVFAFRDNYRSERATLSGGQAVLRIVNDHHEVVLFYQAENGMWIKLDHSFEMSGFHHNVLGDFLSLRIALNAVGEGQVTFKSFIYKALT